MNNSLRSRAVVAFAGHFGLVLSIVTDHYRRTSGEGQPILLSAISFIGLAVGAFLFVRNPHAFFMVKEYKAEVASYSNLGLRMTAWLVVVGVPVLWLFAIMELASLISSALTIRFLGAYSFFAWVVASIILWPYLFGRQGVRS
ncbi:hypothetical protein LXT12_26210 [Pelomonas sp. P7]|uniref:Tripartite tricarboxylate transporter TctB family protein n=1 Tax=Pelomonas caseinilytica TaxID=2906763 RepID=A0ABS8XIQ1_9BURK|nr:hypothetical protein [Pelomonas sp. P7]MCE4540729.1 hypothetical protein [Pelomonas sp. P7]